MFALVSKHPVNVSGVKWSPVRLPACITAAESAVVQWSSRCSYSTPLFHWSTFNDVFVQISSPPSLTLIHVAPSLLDSPLPSHTRTHARTHARTHTYKHAHTRTITHTHTPLLPLDAFSLLYHLCSPAISPCPVVLVLHTSLFRPVVGSVPMETNVGPQTNVWACKHNLGERVEMKRSEWEKEKERGADPNTSPDMAVKNPSVKATPALIIF